MPQQPDKGFVFVVGLPGVGKTTFANFLARAISSHQINSGEALRSHLRTKEVRLDDPVETGKVFLEHFGEHVAGEVILSAARRSRANIVDGVRLVSTLTYFEALDLAVDVVYLDTAEPVRRARFRKRSIAEGEATALNFETILAGKDSWGKDLERFARLCRWRFDNSGSIEELLAFVEEVSRDLTLAR